MWDQNEDLYIILIRGWNDPWKTKSGHRYQELSLKIATFKEVSTYEDVVKPPSLWQTLIIMVFIPNQINMNNRLWCVSGIAYKKTLALPSYRETLKQNHLQWPCSVPHALLCSAEGLLGTCWQKFLVFFPQLCGILLLAQGHADTGTPPCRSRRRVAHWEHTPSISCIGKKLWGMKWLEAKQKQSVVAFKTEDKLSTIILGCHYSCGDWDLIVCDSK